MDYSAKATTKDAACSRRRRSCTPPRFSSTPPQPPFENGDLPIMMMIDDHYLCAGKSLIPRIFIIVRGV